MVTDFEEICGLTRKQMKENLRRHIGTYPHRFLAPIAHALIAGASMVTIQPGPVAPGKGYDLEEKHRTADLIFVEDGRGVHKVAGTTQGPQSFDQEGLKRIIGRAAVVILNGRERDLDLGVMFIAYGNRVGQTVPIDVEPDNWIPWARYILPLTKLDCIPVLRVPVTDKIPDDLQEKIDFSLEQDPSATKH